MLYCKVQSVCLQPPSPGQDNTVDPSRLPSAFQGHAEVLLQKIIILKTEYSFI